MQRRRTSTAAAGMQDIGKDLFAYLFLVIMIFTFMVLISTSRNDEGLPGHRSPQKHELKDGASLMTMSNSKLGRLEKKDDKLFLRFGSELYDPADIERLQKDGRVSETKGDDGKGKPMLFLQEDKENSIYLAEYLSTFQMLGNKGIGIAFVERIK